VAFLFVCFFANAQQDTTKVKNDSSASFLPTYVKVGVDIFPLAHELFGSDASYLEVVGEMDFKFILLNVELGTVDYSVLNEDYFSYSAKGNYSRFGVDLNVIPNDINNNEISFGARIGMSKFEQGYAFNTTNFMDTAEVKGNGWPLAELNYRKRGVGATWLELTNSVSVKIFKGLYLGYTIRLKMKPTVTNVGTATPYYIPGFGKNHNTSQWGFNYYVYYVLPFRKK